MSWSDMIFLIIAISHDEKESCHKVTWFFFIISDIWNMVTMWTFAEIVQQYIFKEKYHKVDFFNHCKMVAKRYFDTYCKCISMIKNYHVTKWLDNFYLCNMPFSGILEYILICYVVAYYKYHVTKWNDNIWSW